MAVTWDGRRKAPVLIFSDMGGIDRLDIVDVAASTLEELIILAPPQRLSDVHRHAPR